MKKSICIFMIMAILSSCIYASANTDAYTCKPIIGLDPTKNVIDLEFSLDDNMPNDFFMIALYNNGQFKKLYNYSLSEIQDIVDSNVGVTDAKKKKYVSLELTETPDSIKVFAWDNSFIPVCKEIDLLADGEAYEAANSIVSTEVSEARTLLYNVRWGIGVQVTFEYEEEIELYELLYDLSADVLKRSDEMLFTRELAQEVYEKELTIIKNKYLGMNKTKKDHFYNCFYSLGRQKFAHFDYLINFLGIKDYLLD